MTSAFDKSWTLSDCPLTKPPGCLAYFDLNIRVYSYRFFPMQTASTEDVEESPYDIIEKRDNMLENLLVLLNSAAAIGVGPTPKEFAGGEEKPRPKSSSQMPGTGMGIQRG